MAFDPLAKIKAAKDDIVAIVPLPEWGIDVRMVAPRGNDRKLLEEQARQHGDKQGRLDSIRYRGVAFNLCIRGARERTAENNGAENIPFEDWTPTIEDGMDIAREKNGLVVERVFDKALELLGQTPLKEEQLEKN